VCFCHNYFTDWVRFLARSGLALYLCWLWDTPSPFL